MYRAFNHSGDSCGFFQHFLTRVCYCTIAVPVEVFIVLTKVDTVEGQGFDRWDVPSNEFEKLKEQCAEKFQVLGATECKIFELGNYTDAIRYPNAGVDNRALHFAKAILECPYNPGAPPPSVPLKNVITHKLGKLSSTKFTLGFKGFYIFVVLIACIFFCVFAYVVFLLKRETDGQHGNTQAPANSTV